MALKGHAVCLFWVAAWAFLKRDESTPGAPATQGKAAAEDAKRRIEGRVCIMRI